MKLSAVVLTRNEEKNIIDCLECLSFCDEIIIVDDNSTDRTKELVEEFNKENKKVKVFTRSLGNDFSNQRQFGIEKASNDWIFFVDADERISQELANEICESLSSPDYSGFQIPRIDYMWGKILKHGETGNIKLLRLFDKKKGSLRGKVHEVWETKQDIGQLNYPILHYPHPTISDFLKEINFYSDLRTQELFNAGRRSRFLSIILYPNAKFIKNYFLKLGILDGIPGFVHAVLMSFHSFLVRGKLWLLWQKEKSL